MPEENIQTEKKIDYSWYTKTELVKLATINDNIITNLELQVANLKNAIEAYRSALHHSKNIESIQTKIIEELQSKS